MPSKRKMGENRGLREQGSRTAFSRDEGKGQGSLMSKEKRPQHRGNEGKIRKQHNCDRKEEVRDGEEGKKKTARPAKKDENTE